LSVFVSKKSAKIYHFDASQSEDIQVGDFAVVETTRGRQLGEVVQILRTRPAARKAPGSRSSARDPARPGSAPDWQQKRVEAMINCRAKAAE
jgi:cell fate regulator YaaT (PSP1 superfamily)